MEGYLVQISVSPGGVPKLSVESARVGELGVEGDTHRDTEHHGGPDRAVCLYAMERIRALQGEGHPIVPGALGENLTLEGVAWDRIVPGSRLRVGATVVLEVTRYTSPCANITDAFGDGDYARVSQKRHAGWSRVYARVLAPGVIRRGDPVRLAVDEGENSSR
ncbi:MAG: MOSC domain-containing protein [Candidatus Rokubacteria bacterium]|nr:MOSC domain-containing protein [Candidatus Rokubacteria bacterium]